MTRRARLLALTTLFTLAAAAPALADWAPVTRVQLNAAIPSVNIVDPTGVVPDRVDALSFRAENTDVMCHSVEGIFRSGQTMRLFSGMLPAGHENVIWMIPVHRDLARIDLQCHPVNGEAGDINIAADIPPTRLIITRP